MKKARRMVLRQGELLALGDRFDHVLTTCWRWGLAVSVAGALSVVIEQSASSVRELLAVVILASAALFSRQHRTTLPH